MILRLPRIRIGGEARALRFLMLFLCCWIAMRTMATWHPSASSLDDAASPWASPPPLAIVAAAAQARPALLAPVTAKPEGPRSPSGVFRHVAGRRPGAPAAVGAGSGGLDPGRRDLRLVMMERLPPEAPASAAAFPGRSGGWSAMPPAASPPLAAAPFPMQRELSGWSLAAWLYWRNGSERTPGGIADASQLGGSQAGMRLAYGIGGNGRVRAYGRATIAVERPKQRELAFGVAVAPVRRWPVDVAVERRLAIGREGRNAFAVMATGGVSDVSLPHGFRFDLYAQAGVVGARHRDGFADGAVVVDHRIGPDESARVRAGVFAAAAAQPGAARVDVGPRVTLRLPHVGKGSRIALDWRQRIAGDATPESGVALTLATDF